MAARPFARRSLRLAGTIAFGKRSNRIPLNRASQPTSAWCAIWPAIYAPTWTAWLRLALLLLLALLLILAGVAYRVAGLL